jgi:hypothetical protein
MPAADRRDQLRLRVAPKLFHVEQFWRAESFGDLQIVPRGTIVTIATDVDLDLRRITVLHATGLVRHWGEVLARTTRS